MNVKISLIAQLVNLYKIRFGFAILIASAILADLVLKVICAVAPRSIHRDASVDVKLITRICQCFTEGFIVDDEKLANHFCDIPLASLSCLSYFKAGYLVQVGVAV